MLQSFTLFLTLQLEGWFCMTLHGTTKMKYGIAGHVNKRFRDEIHGWINEIRHFW